MIKNTRVFCTWNPFVSLICVYSTLFSVYKPERYMLSILLEIFVTKIGLYASGIFLKSVFLLIPWATLLFLLLVVPIDFGPGQVHRNVDTITTIIFFNLFSRAMVCIFSAGASLITDVFQLMNSIYFQTIFRLILKPNNVKNFRCLVFLCSVAVLANETLL